MKSIKKKVDEFRKRRLILNFVTDIGEIIEEDDRLVCKVSYKKLKDLCVDAVYRLNLDGINCGDKELSGKIAYYGLDKPIYYIFDGIEFDKTLEFYANIGTFVIFRNCIFRHGVFVYWADDVTFENNSYYYDDVKYSFGNTFLYSLYNNIPMIRDLRFVNDNLVSLDLVYHPSKFGMNIDIDNLEIIDTKIDLVGEESSFCVKAFNTKIINSSIDVDEFYLDSNNIMIDSDSSIRASNGIIIDGENVYLGSNDIETPYLVYNGVEVIGSTNNDVDNNEEELRNSRIDFTNVIGAIMEKCVLENEKKFNEIRERLENRTLKRILKK